MPKTRTFIAIEAADQAHGAAMSVIDRLRSATEGMKWVDAEKLHFTLQFLGDLDDREMAEVCMRTVRVAARHAPFELEVRGVGAFPSIQKPRTVWLGAGQGADQFIALHADIERALADLGHVAGQAFGAFDQGADLVGRQALGDGQAALHGAFLAQDAQHLGQRGAGREDELGRAQRPAVTGDPCGEGEGARVADGAAFVQYRAPIV